MAERKTKPVEKATVSRAAGAAAGQSRPLKAASVMAPQKAAAKKTASAAAKPKTTGTPAVRKAAAPTAARKAPAQKAVATSARPVVKKAIASPTAEERYRMVQTAAYFIAERNGFSGCPTEYWAAAELEIAGRLGR